MLKQSQHPALYRECKRQIIIYHLIVDLPHFIWTEKSSYKFTLISDIHFDSNKTEEQKYKKKTPSTN